MIGPLREHGLNFDTKVKVKLTKSEFHCYFIAWCTAFHVFLTEGEWKLR